MPDFGINSATPWRTLAKAARHLLLVALTGFSVVFISGCGPQVWVVVGPETENYLPVDAPAADPLTNAADGLLARMLEAGFVTDAPQPVSMAIQSFRLHDPTPPDDLQPVGDRLHARLYAELERAEQIDAVRASVIPGTPAMIGEGKPPQLALALEVFRLLDVPSVPDHAFYFVRLWAFDLQTRQTVWEATSDPIAWLISTTEHQE